VGVIIMGVFYGYSFWMDRIFAMNECGCYYGCILWVFFLDGQKFDNEYGNVGVMGVYVYVSFILHLNYLTMSHDFMVYNVHLLDI